MQIFPIDLPRPAPDVDRKLIRRAAPERLHITPMAQSAAQAIANHPPPGPKQKAQAKGGFIWRPFQRRHFQMA